MVLVLVVVLVGLLKLGVVNLLSACMRASARSDAPDAPLTGTAALDDVGRVEVLEFLCAGSAGPTRRATLTVHVLDRLVCLLGVDDYVGLDPARSAQLDASDTYFLDSTTAGTSSATRLLGETAAASVEDMA